MTRLVALGLAALLALAGGGVKAGSWREAAPMESARTQVRAAALGDEIYVGGGATLSGPSNIFEAYDPRSNHWLPLESMPEGRDLFGMAVSGNEIFVAGGLSSLGKGQPSASVYSFDVSTNAWKRRADLPAARIGLSLTAAAGQLYAIGGRGWGAERVVRYYPCTDKWSAFGAAMPAPRAGHGAAALGNKIYVVGGRSHSGETLARVDIFDTSSGTWSAGPGLPVATTGLTADFLGSELHIVGGVAPAQKRTLSDHYALLSGAWQRQNAMPTARQGLSSAALGGRWFAIGGGAGGGALAVFTETDVVEVYSP